MSLPTDDLIEVRGLRVLGCHGVTEHERQTRQPFLVDIDIEHDAFKAAHSDDLADTVDYTKICRRAVDVVESESYRLLESLAFRLCSVIIENHAVIRATVRVTKPNAELGVDAEVAVLRTRFRDDARR